MQKTYTTKDSESMIVQCGCFDYEHAMFLDLVVDENHTFLSITKKYISYLPWWKRLYKAFLYVIKREPEYMWDSTIINSQETANEIVKMLQKIK